MTNPEFNFREGFQDEILATMCRNPAEMCQIESLIDPVYFRGLHASIVASKLKDFFAEYRDFPTFEELRQFVEDRFGPDEQEKAREVNEYVDNLEDVEVRSVKYVRDSVAAWCRERAVINAIVVCANAIKAGRQQWPKEGFATLLDEAMRVGKDMEQLGYSLADDVDTVVSQLTAGGYGVHSGLRHLDGVWHNGWMPGWLVVPLAPPKGYKSTFEVNLGLNTSEGIGMEQGVPVFHYTLEISAELTLARAYCALSGLTMQQMFHGAQSFVEGVKTQLGSRWANGSGSILVKSYPAKSASIADIRDHALHASEVYEVKPRVIIIDHAEVVRPNKRADKYSDWRQQADIYAEARALGQELGATVIMPDRCNRETVSKSVPDMTSFQGSFEKAGVVDVAIGLCQSEEERAMADKFEEVPIRYFVFLNRHGPTCGYFSGTVMQSTFRMSVDKKISYRDELEAAERKAKGRRSIRQRVEEEEE